MPRVGARESPPRASESGAQAPPEGPSGHQVHFSSVTSRWRPPLPSGHWLSCCSGWLVRAPIAVYLFFGVCLPTAPCREWWTLLLLQGPAQAQLRCKQPFLGAQPGVCLGKVLRCCDLKDGMRQIRKEGSGRGKEGGALGHTSHWLKMNRCINVENHVFE